jgi:hypothetical protein
VARTTATYLSTTNLIKILSLRLTIVAIEHLKTKRLSAIKALEIVSNKNLSHLMASYLSVS